MAKHAAPLTESVARQESEALYGTHKGTGKRKLVAPAPLPGSHTTGYVGPRPARTHTALQGAPILGAL